MVLISQSWLGSLRKARWLCRHLVWAPILGRRAPSGVLGGLGGAHSLEAKSREEVAGLPAQPEPWALPGSPQGTPRNRLCVLGGLPRRLCTGLC